MPAIEQIQRVEAPSAKRERIEQLKQSAANRLDDTLAMVAKNLGREEAKSARAEALELGESLAAQEEALHFLDPARVADLLADPFEDE